MSISRRKSRRTSRAPPALQCSWLNWAQSIQGAWNVRAKSKMNYCVVALLLHAPDVWCDGLCTGKVVSRQGWNSGCRRSPAIHHSLGKCGMVSAGLRDETWVFRFMKPLQISHAVRVDERWKWGQWVWFGALGTQVSEALRCNQILRWSLLEAVLLLQGRRPYSLIPHFYRCFPFERVERRPAAWGKLQAFMLRILPRRTSSSSSPARW